MRAPRLLLRRAGLSRAVVLVCSLQFLVSSQPAAAEELPEAVSTEPDSYQETLVRPEPVDGDALPLDPEPYVNAEPWYVLPERRVPWYYARFRGGGSYFNVPGDTKFGGEYGGDVVVPLVQGFAGYANLSLNHISGGTQVLGTVGMIKIARRDDTGLTQGLAGMVFFDQYTDTRIDDLYLSSLRVGVSKSLSPCTRIGAMYTEPLEEDDAEFALFPGANPISVPLSPTRSIRTYLSRRFDSTLVSGWSAGRHAAGKRTGVAGRPRRPVFAHRRLRGRRGGLRRWRALRSAAAVAERLRSPVP